MVIAGGLHNNEALSSLSLSRARTWLTNECVLSLAAVSREPLTARPSSKVEIALGSERELRMTNALRATESLSGIYIAQGLRENARPAVSKQIYSAFLHFPLDSVLFTTAFILSCTLLHFWN
jgi:hypothetical protein